MTKRISPYQFTDHREFIRTALKEKGFSYRSFCARYSDIVSVITLALTLSKGRSGLKNKPTRNFSPETLARIGKALKLTDDEIQFLLVLKFQNDAEVFSGVYGNAYVEAMQGLMRELKSKPQPSSSKHSSIKKNFSETACSAAELIDCLAESPRQKLCKEILTEARAIQARQIKKPGAKKLASILSRFSELVKMGAS